MQLSFKREWDSDYHSRSQQARKKSENWVIENMFCPRCGHEKIIPFPNNKPLADFFCPACGNQYELKSKNGNFSSKITDGAYQTMIERIGQLSNPDFFLMSYNMNSQTVVNFSVIPKFFFIPEIIEKRKPLSPTARRAGWVGCNILLSAIPLQGRISIIDQGKIRPRKEVIHELQQSRLLDTNNIAARGWLFDILNCVNHLPDDVFSLENIYQYLPALELKYPKNHHIHAKIRQQLQRLRDARLIEFLGKGQYRKLKNT